MTKDSRMFNPKTIIAVLVLLVCFIAVPFFFATSQYIIGLVEMFLIWGLLAMTLDILVGYGGLVSLGHGSFFGIAAYVTGILTLRYNVNSLTAMLAALLVCLVFSVIVGVMVSHLKDISFMMVTLAISQVVWGLAVQWDSMTGGDNGLSGVQRLTIEGVPISGSSFYYLILGIVLFCAVLLFFIMQSPFGLAIKGIKQSESRMRVLGYNVWLYKVILMVISGFFAGVAGVMWVQYIGFVGPTMVSLQTSSQALLMVLIGGAGTLFGSLVGALVIVFTQNVISTFTDRWNLILGAFYIFVVLFLQGGITGYLTTLKAKLFLKKTVPLSNKDSNEELCLKTNDS